MPVADEGEIIFLFESFWRYLVKNKWEKPARWTEIRLNDLGAKSKKVRLDSTTTKYARVIRNVDMEKLPINLPKFKEEDNF